MSPIDGAINLDNSPSVRLAKHKIISKIGSAMGLFRPEQQKYIDFCKNNDIKWSIQSGNSRFGDSD